MTIRCLVLLSTSAGQGVAEILVNSLHQLAIVMPAPVVSYEVRDNGDSGFASVSDTELFDLLVGVVRDIEKERETPLPSSDGEWPVNA